MKNYTAYFADGSTLKGKLTVCPLADSSRESKVHKYELLEKLNYKEISYIDIEINESGIASGEDGFYILNNGFNEKTQNMRIWDLAGICWALPGTVF